MQQAIQEAREGIAAGHGGPFGSVVVKEGVVVGSGHNRVLANNDPTCHGEIEAIRNACAALGTHDLSGCVLYTTSEPCPMCLGAVLWANIETVVYGCTIADAEAIGFRDLKFARALGGAEGSGSALVEMRQEQRDACLQVFEEYSASQHSLY